VALPEPMKQMFIESDENLGLMIVSDSSFYSMASPPHPSLNHHFMMVTASFKEGALAQDP
jgi:hypothetical protein